MSTERRHQDRSRWLSQSALDYHRTADQSARQHQQATSRRTQLISLWPCTSPASRVAYVQDGDLSRHGRRRAPFDANLGIPLCQWIVLFGYFAPARPSVELLLIRIISVDHASSNTALFLHTMVGTILSSPVLESRRSVSIRRAKRGGSLRARRRRDSESLFHRRFSRSGARSAPDAEKGRRARWDSNPRPSDRFHRHGRDGVRSPTLYPD